MSDLIKPIPRGQQHDWEVRVDGRVVPAQEVRITSAKFDGLAWGLRPEGTVGWMWRELGGGGSGIVPYAVIEGKLHIGMVEQDRAGCGGKTWNIPRGFLGSDQTHLVAARQELFEEVGYINPRDRLRELNARNANPNSTFFDTSSGDGFVFFEFKVFDYELEPDGNGSYRFRDHTIQAESTMGERITQGRFFLWQVVARAADMFSNAGFARLLVNHFDLIEFL